MLIDPHATDRVVVAGAGFGVWYTGRHLGSARWADVIRVRAFKPGDVATDLMYVALGLRDGTEILVHERLPGFERFLAAAESHLPGMQGQATWRAAGAQPSVTNETVLFERQAR